MGPCALGAPHAPHLYAGLDIRTMRPLPNPDTLKQRFSADFTTCTSSRSVVPKTWAMKPARQSGSTGAAKASQRTAIEPGNYQKSVFTRHSLKAVPRAPLVDPAVRRFQLGLGPARGRLWGPCRRPARAQGSLPWSTRDGFT